MRIVRGLLNQLPASVVDNLRQFRRRLQGVPLAGRFDFGDFRRLAPASRVFGYDRGLPIDRYYVDRFLAHCAADIAGRVLEVGDNEYTRRFGGDRVTVSDILHVRAGSPGATIVADLQDAPQVPSGTFDAIILTQTLHLLYDLHPAVETLHRILKPGGVLLVTVPGVSCAPVRNEWAATWCWSFTAHSLRRLLGDVFGGRVKTSVYGNVLTAVAFLEGICTAELRQDELDHADPDYPVTIAARVVKAGRAA